MPRSGSDCIGSGEMLIQPVPHTDPEELVSVPLKAASPSPLSVDSSTPDPQTWLGKWVLVRYEKKLYPGVVQEVEEEDVLVKCMARVGENRFFWPMLAG